MGTIIMGKDGATKASETNPVPTIDYDASGNIIGDYALKVEENTSDSNIVYIGRAAIGSATSAAVWQIKRVVSTSTGETITWVDSNANFDNTWDGRESHTYG